MKQICGIPWDGFDAYIFDIDGTLLHCADAVHYFAFCDALGSVSGRSLTLDGVIAHGNTDVGILRDAFALAGVLEQEWRPRLPEIKKRMCTFVSDRADQLQVQPLASAATILEHLRSRGSLLSVATGNLEVIGKLKLNKAKLLDLFSRFFWSDRFEYRSDVFGAAACELKRTLGNGARVCAVGDTPLDVSAARDHGIQVIAVATGIYSLNELSAADPDLCIASFADLL